MRTALEEKVLDFEWIRFTKCWTQVHFQWRTSSSSRSALHSATICLGITTSNSREGTSIDRAAGRKLKIKLSGSKDTLSHCFWTTSIKNTVALRFRWKSGFKIDATKSSDRRSRRKRRLQIVRKPYLYLEFCLLQSLNELCWTSTHCTAVICGVRRRRWMTENSELWVLYTISFKIFSIEFSARVRNTIL